LLTANQVFVDAKLDPDGPTPLVTACRAGEGENAAAVATVSVLIENMADVNLLDGKGDSPLILSTLLSHAALVEVLLGHGAHPNCRDAYGWTPLHYAAQAQNTIIAEALLARGANPLTRISNANQYAPLHVAAQNQAVNIIRLLYRANPGLDLKTSAGFTALHIAAIHNWGPTVQTLLELGAPKDAVDNNGRTALFLAAEEGARDALKCLIDARCDVRVVATDGRTVLHGAASSGKASIVRYIMRNLTIEDSNMLLSKRSEYGETVMHAVVRGGSAKVAGIILGAGADATVGDTISSSPLHYAASFGHKALSYQILEQTRDPNPRTEGGNTPLHLAALAGKLEFMQQFFEDCSRLALQIDVNAENVSKQTPFMLALVQGREDAAKFLLERTPVSKPDIRGNYPIHFAAFYGFDSIVTALLTHDGASSKDSLGRTTLSNAAITGQTRTVKLLATGSPELLNIRNQAESTPVLDAIMYNHLDCAHYLLDSGAEYEVMDEQGNSLLHAAAWSGDMPMVQRLLKAGCRVDAANRFGETVLHKAVDANSVEIVDALIAAGLSDVDVQTHRGDSIVMIAAERGNLTMMLKLGSYGADYGISNHLGRTAAHAAASCGNVAILTFLRSRGEDLHLPDNEGYTPLLMAASAGYPETVKFLLQSPGSAVNRLSTWQRESPLTLAAKGRYPFTIRPLLAAGGDPQHREASGCSALDYASLHPACLREFHATQHVTDSGTIEEQRRTVYHTIRRCREALLLASEEPSIRELYLRLMALDMLSDALHLVQDYGAAITCYKELYWPPETDLLRVDYTCHICGVKQFTESVYVCKSCYPKINLCAACHADYESFGRRAPKAFLELLELERRVRSVRIASEGLPILRIVGAVVRIEAANSWLSTARDQYDGWEQKYNSNRRYEELQRPGQEFVKLVKEVEELAIKVGNKHVAEPEDREALASRNKIYQDHQRKHSPDKEISEFLCKSHEYVVVSASKLAQSENSNLDPISGRITLSFLRELQIAYRQDSGTQTGALDEENTRAPLEMSKTTGTKSDTESSHLHEVVGTSEKKLDEVLVGLEGPLSLSKPEGPQRVDKLTLVPAVGRTTVGSVHSPTGGRVSSLKRAFSLPTPMAGDSVWKDHTYTTDTDHVEVLAAVQTCIDSDNASITLSANASRAQVRKKGMATMPHLEKHESLVKRHGTFSELPATSIPDENAAPASTNSPLLSLRLSDEPDPIEDIPTYGDAIASTDAQGSLEEILFLRELGDWVGGLPCITNATRTALQIARQMPRGPSQTLEEWVYMSFGVSITDAMIPGFTREYLQLKWEMRDEAYEEQDEMADASNRGVTGHNANNSDEDSDDE
jgi:ankyrin repeat protein